MLGVLDIAPAEIAAERIDIRGTEIEVRGLRNREWAGLMRRFPELRKQAAGIAIPPEEAAVLSLELTPAVMAIVLGQPENVIDERFSDAEQAHIFGVIMRLTNAPSPLAESPAAAGQANGAATTSPPPLSN